MGERAERQLPVEKGLLWLWRRGKRGERASELEIGGVGGGGEATA